MSTFDRGYAAGLFEGEGSVSISRSGKSAIPIACIRMCDRDALERFQQAVGCGVIYGPSQIGRSKPIYQWRINGLEKVIYLFQFMQPGLGARRTERFTAVIAEGKEHRKMRQAKANTRARLHLERLKTLKMRDLYHRAQLEPVTPDPLPTVGS